MDKDIEQQMSGWPSENIETEEKCGSCTSPETYRNGLCKGCYKGEMKFNEDNDK